MGVPISSLPAASALTGAELFPVVQSGVTKRTTTDAMPYTPAGTGAITTTVQSKLRETVSVFDFMTAAQIAYIQAGDTASQDAAAVTAAFVAAIGTGNVNVYVPQGIYKVSTFAVKSYTTLYGDGLDSIIISDGSANHIITGQYVYHVTIQNLQIRGNAGRTNLCGIYMDGAVWTILENLFVQYNGSHGIQFTNVATAYAGSYPVMVKGVHSNYNAGDGYRQQGTSGANQQNAVYIAQSEFQGNSGNGLTLWGYGISVHQTVSEGNTGYGVYFDNGLNAGVYSAARLSVTDCYFELNYAGHIAARCGTYGAIVGMTIANNLYNTNGTLLGAGFKNFSVVNVGSVVNTIRDLDYRNNQHIISGTDPTVYADFANAPNNASQIEPFYASLSATDITTVPAKYTNIGYATFKYVDSLVLNGYWYAKGGTGITYSDRVKSASVTVSGSNTFFPVQVPMGSQLLFFAVPIETDCTSYTVNMSLRGRAYDSTASQAVIAFASGTGAGTQLVRTSLVVSYAAVQLINTTRSELLIELSVTWTTPGTYFYIGSPTVYYVSP